MDDRGWRQLRLRDENASGALRVAHWPKADDFECDGAIETFLSRAINYALTAATDFLQQFVVAKVSKHSCATAL